MSIASLREDNGHHRPAESGDEPTDTEIEQIHDMDLPLTDEVLLAYRAGWDQGAADRVYEARSAARRAVNA